MIDYIFFIKSIDILFTFNSILFKISHFLYLIKFAILKINKIKIIDQYLIIEK